MVTDYRRYSGGRYEGACVATAVDRERQSMLRGIPRSIAIALQQRYPSEIANHRGTFNANVVGPRHSFRRVADDSAQAQIDGFRCNDRERMKRPSSERRVVRRCCIKRLQSTNEGARRGGVVFASYVDPSEQLQQTRAYRAGRQREPFLDDCVSFIGGEGIPAAQCSIICDFGHDARRTPTCGGIRIAKKLFTLRSTSDTGQRRAAQCRRTDFVGGPFRRVQ